MFSAHLEIPDYELDPRGAERLVRQVAQVIRTHVRARLDAGRGYEGPLPQPEADPDHPPLLDSRQMRRSLGVSREAPTPFRRRKARNPAAVRRFYVLPIGHRHDKGRKGSQKRHMEIAGILASGKHCAARRWIGATEQEIAEAQRYINQHWRPTLGGMRASRVSRR